MHVKIRLETQVLTVWDVSILMEMDGLTQMKIILSPKGPMQMIPILLNGMMKMEMDMAIIGGIVAGLIETLLGQVRFYQVHNIRMHVH